MSQPRPNLFLIGSMKSGTTHLSELLGDHPSIFMSTPKEPCHFVEGNALRKVWVHAWKLGYWRGVDEYLSLFDHAGDAPVIAEASMVYSHLPICSGVAQRIVAFNPQARFIYIMRDPIERTISHYWHRVRWWGERRPMLAAFRSDPQYMDVSHYARQLKEYLRYVGPERIYVLTYEALLANSAKELSRLYAWLNVDPSFRSARIGIPANERPDIVEQARGLGLLDKVRHSPVYLKVAPYIPRAVRRFAARLAVRIVRPAEVPIAQVEAYLRAHQLPQTEELSILLNRSFPEWTTLYAEAEQHNAPLLKARCH